MRHFGIHRRWSTHRRSQRRRVCRCHRRRRGNPHCRSTEFPEADRSVGQLRSTRRCDNQRPKSRSRCSSRTCRQHRRLRSGTLHRLSSCFHSARRSDHRLHSFRRGIGLHRCRYRYWATRRGRLACRRHPPHRRSCQFRPYMRPSCAVSRWGWAVRLRVLPRRWQLLARSSSCCCNRHRWCSPGRRPEHRSCLHRRRRRTDTHALRREANTRLDHWGSRRRRRYTPLRRTVRLSRTTLYWQPPGNRCSPGRSTCRRGIASHSNRSSCRYPRHRRCCCGSLRDRNTPGRPAYRIDLRRTRSMHTENSACSCCHLCPSAYTNPRRRMTYQDNPCRRCKCSNTSRLGRCCSRTAKRRCRNRRWEHHTFRTSRFPTRSDRWRCSYRRSVLSVCSCRRHRPGRSHTAYRPCTNRSRSCSRMNRFGNRLR